MTTALLPRNPTATDVIDALSDQAYELVIKVNPGKQLSRPAFARVHARTFAAMLDKFLTSLDERNPSLAERIRAEFLNQQDERATNGEG